MKKYYYFLFIISLVGCFILWYSFYRGQTYKKMETQREITKEEINSFVPINYSTVLDVDGTLNIKKYENSYLLPLRQDKGESGYAEYNNSIGSAKILILQYNKNKDKYIKFGEYIPDYIDDYFTGFDDIKSFDNVFDIDKDGIKEYFVVFQLSGTSGSSRYLEVLKLEDNKLFKIVRIPFGDYYYNNTTNEIISVNYIWGEGEPHYGCHYYNILKYKFNGMTFQLINTKQSQNRYSNDNELKWGECDSSGYSANNIYELLKIEGF